MTNSNISVQNIVVNSINASTKKVIAVGASLHAKATIGYKVRFTDKTAQARVSTLLATKEHSDIIFYTLNVQCTELAATLVALQQGEHHNEQQTSAMQAFVNKFNAQEQSNAQDELSTNNVQIIAVLK